MGVADLLDLDALDEDESFEIGEQAAHLQHAALGIDEIRRRAEAGDRTVSAWIRRAVEHELEHPAS